MTSGNAPNDAEDSVRTHGTMTTPRSVSSLSTTTPTVTTATTMVTPRSILPCPYRNAASLLHHETTAAIRDIVVAANGNDIPRDIRRNDANN